MLHLQVAPEQLQPLLRRVAVLLSRMPDCLHAALPGFWKAAREEGAIELVRRDLAQVQFA